MWEVSCQHDNLEIQYKLWEQRGINYGLAIIKHAEIANIELYFNSAMVCALPDGPGNLENL